MGAARARNHRSRLLTPRAALAIVNSWDVRVYNPSGTNYTSWLAKVHNLWEQYGIPIAQRASCAICHMRADCKEAARGDKCYNMGWEGFSIWYDRKLRALIFIRAPC